MAFIVFEGLDGSGKSSLISLLVAKLQAEKRPHIVTREPGGTPLGDSIRDLILRANQIEGTEGTVGSVPCARTELLLYEASRAQHVDLVIKPALQTQKWVLCDRYTASSVAFQGGGRDIEMSEVEWLNGFATGGLNPDLTVLLDLSVDEARRRQKKRELSTGQAADRIESERDDFHERVRKSFLEQAAKHNAQLNTQGNTQGNSEWLVLDATLSPQILFKQLEIKLKDLRC